MSARKSLSRRTFLKVSAGTGAGLVLGCYAKPDTQVASVKGRAELTPSAWLRIGEDGLATVTISKSDMGQGARTALSTIVAEELDIAWEDVRIEQADGDPQRYGSQSTGGSGSVRSMWTPLRMTGATARMMLVAAAAQKWGVSPDQCRVENGRVSTSGPGRELAFGELVSIAATMTIPERSTVKLKDPKDYKLVGKEVGRLDAPDIVSGKATYGFDIHIPGMRYAVIERTPAFGARVRSVDDSAALKVPGVRKVVQVPTGVAVVGDNTWAVLEGRLALEVDWDLGPNAKLDSAQIREMLQGEVAAFPETSAAKSTRAVYDLPYLAHAPMEPMNAVADVKADSAVVWAPTQSADRARSDVAQAIGLPATAVTLRVPLIGGGFGRRLNSDYAVEAATLSKLIGEPVQVVWSRDDDMRHDYYRPTSHHVLQGGVDASGMPVEWAHQMIGPGGGRRVGGEFSPTRTNYDIPTSCTMRRGGVPLPIPTGAWRSVESSQTCFVDESFFDELAHLGGQDPLEVRLKTVQNPRIRKCLEAVKEHSGWGKPMPKGSGRGVAAFGGFGSFIAVVAEVTVRAGVVKVDRVVAAVDCGVVVSPSGARAQIEGAVVDGVSTVLHAGITIKNGGVLETSFRDYPWIKMSEMPHVEVHLVPSGDAPGGLGEPGYPPVPPAVANAIFAATGKRIRRLPMQDGDLD